MERLGERTRDIRFYSNKNGDIVCLHSKWARNYARWLEEQAWVQSYQVGCPLDADIMGRISRAGIRTDYLQPLTVPITAKNSTGTASHPISQ